MSPDFTPSEVAAMDANAEQLMMAIADVERFACDALAVAPENDKLRSKLRFNLKNHRARMAVYPVRENGVLGGLDGDATVGNADAAYIAPRGSDLLPSFRYDDPAHRRTPIVVVSWNLDHEWIVRTPHRIEDILQGFQVSAPTPCDWHMGTCRTNGKGSERSSLLVLVSGQYLVLILVCAGCRERLDKSHGNGLRWIGLDHTGRVVLPDEPS